MTAIADLKHELASFADKNKALFFPRFFKTGPGEYGEGDIFLGVTVPKVRIIARKYRDLTLSGVAKLLSSKIHEERLAALIILVDKYKRAGNEDRKAIYEFYLQNTKHINNWDLVDLSGPKIIGEYVYENDAGKVLGKLAYSSNLWERRIAILSTYAYIKRGDYSQTLKISEILLSDKHDLIHKAVGWMLREVGKGSEITLKKFLKKNYKKIPRTALRYSIERFSEQSKSDFLKGNF